MGHGHIESPTHTPSGNAEIEIETRTLSLLPRRIYLLHRSETRPRTKGRTSFLFLVRPTDDLTVPPSLSVMRCSQRGGVDPSIGPDAELAPRLVGVSRLGPHATRSLRRCSMCIHDSVHAVPCVNDLVAAQRPSRAMHLTFSGTPHHRRDQRG